MSFNLTVSIMFSVGHMSNNVFDRQKEKEQLAALKKHHEEEIDHHKKEIERLSFCTFQILI